MKYLNTNAVDYSGVFLSDVLFLTPFHPFFQATKQHNFILFVPVSSAENLYFSLLSWSIEARQAKLWINIIQIIIVFVRHIYQHAHVGVGQMCTFQESHVDSGVRWIFCLRFLHLFCELQCLSLLLETSQPLFNLMLDYFYSPLFFSFSHQTRSLFRYLPCRAVIRFALVDRSLPIKWSETQ